MGGARCLSRDCPHRRPHGRHRGRSGRRRARARSRGCDPQAGWPLGGGDPKRPHHASALIDRSPDLFSRAAFADAARLLSAIAPVAPHSNPWQALRDREWGLRASRFRARWPTAHTQRIAAMPGMAPLARIMALAAFGGLFSFELAAFERVQAPPAKPEMTQNCPGLVAFDEIGRASLGKECSSREWTNLVQ